MSSTKLIGQISSYISQAVRCMSNVKDTYDLRTRINFLLSEGSIPNWISVSSSMKKEKPKLNGLRNTKSHMQWGNYRRSG